MNKLIQKYIFWTFRSSILSSIVYTSSLQHWLLNKWECLAAFAAAVASWLWTDDENVMFQNKTRAETTTTAYLQWMHEPQLRQLLHL